MYKIQNYTEVRLLAKVTKFLVRTEEQETIYYTSYHPPKLESACRTKSIRKIKGKKREKQL